MLQIAVVGAGISGLCAAWLLSRRHEVTLFEAEPRLGGHSHTVDVPAADGAAIPVDTGFIVYNEANYPNLTRLFHHLGVETSDSDMSFSVSLDEGRLEYASASLTALFGQRRNALSPSFMRMLFDIQRFNRAGLRFLARDDAGVPTLGDFLRRERLGDDLIWTYLLPMAGAIWSTAPCAMLDFPARTFLRFFANHNLLTLNGQHRWRTVRGGSRRYVQALSAKIAGRIVGGAAVTRVERRRGKLDIRTTDGDFPSFDAVVLACHADTSTGILGDAWPDQSCALNRLRFVTNQVVLHGDAELMPKRRRVWASWNYMAARHLQRSDRPVSVTYWMNRLQSLPGTTPLFVSMNPLREPDPMKVHRRLAYDHPLFDNGAEAGQRHLEDIQGQEGVYFAGAWLGYGFHEDGLLSAIRVAERFGCRPPWSAHVEPGVGDSAFALPERAAALPL